MKKLVLEEQKTRVMVRLSAKTVALRASINSQVGGRGGFAIRLGFTTLFFFLSARTSWIINGRRGRNTRMVSSLPPRHWLHCTSAQRIYKILGFDRFAIFYHCSVTAFPRLTTVIANTLFYMASRSVQSVVMPLKVGRWELTEIYF